MRSAGARFTAPMVALPTVVRWAALRFAGRGAARLIAVPRAAPQFAVPMGAPPLAAPMAGPHIARLGAPITAELGIAALPPFIAAVLITAAPPLELAPVSRRVWRSALQPALARDA
jgi:hypothetical protein